MFELKQVSSNEVSSITNISSGCYKFSQLLRGRHSLAANS